MPRRALFVCADMLESWWWCLQTLTSEGYGGIWAPVTEGGKVTAVIAALFGTIILALPIAVVGVTFDDEWVKQVRLLRPPAALCESLHTSPPRAANDRQRSRASHRSPACTSTTNSRATARVQCPICC